MTGTATRASPSVASLAVTTTGVITVSTSVGAVLAGDASLGGTRPVTATGRKGRTITPSAVATVPLSAVAA